MAKKQIPERKKYDGNCNAENNPLPSNDLPTSELLKCLLQLFSGDYKLVKKECRDIHLWDSGKLIMIEAEKIAYIEAARCYCEINMMDGKKYVPSLPLSKVAAYLPQSSFVRVHRSFLANRKMLKEIDGNRIILPDKTELPIGREYRKALMNSLTIINTQNKKYFL
jgi:DNA-binding LytR/AlgR family response regulator